MPELPEVETTARALRPALSGRTIAGVRALDYAPLVKPYSPEQFAAAVTGRSIAAIGRRGKHLLLFFDEAAALSVHLRMSGRLLLHDQATLPDQHTRVILDLDDGTALHFHDTRKFGRMRLLTARELAQLDERLGPEPLDPTFDAEALSERLQARPRARLKPLLLDQRFLAGLGNIYADEALFRARLHPLRRAGDLSAEEAGRLHQAIVDVLSEAIAAEGTTLTDGGFRFGGDHTGRPGDRGRFAQRLRVYGRADQACPKCDTPIVRTRVAGRSSHFCPHCQPLAPHGTS